jgi:hypothetical protein
LVKKNSGSLFIVSAKKARYALAINPQPTGHECNGAVLLKRLPSLEHLQERGFDSRIGMLPSRG